MNAEKTPKWFHKAIICAYQFATALFHTKGGVGGSYLLVSI